MQKTILFDAMTAAEVKQRLEIIIQNQQIVNAVALTVARMNGAAPDTDVRLNETGTGIIITIAGPYEVDGTGETKPPHGLIESVSENGSTAWK